MVSGEGWNQYLLGPDNFRFVSIVASEWIVSGAFRDFEGCLPLMNSSDPRGISLKAYSTISNTNM